MAANEQVFQYTILYRDKDTTEVVVELAETLARDAEHAKLIAVRKVDAKWDDKLDKLEVQVRAFR